MARLGTLLLYLAFLLYSSFGQGQNSNEDRFQQSGAYLESIFNNYQAAKERICPGFTKRSQVAVVYMCYARGEIIQQALTALFHSKGVNEYDFFISQDGGSGYNIQLPSQSSSANVHVIRHPYNLFPGQHHFFVKSFFFDVMAYDYLLVVEEDNVVHVDALKMMHSLLDLSLNDRQVGLVSINDVDNSVLFDEHTYNASAIRVEVIKGHLWVFGLHRTRYQAVRQDLKDYFDVIKGADYSRIDQPPLVDNVRALFRTKGIDIPELSQDGYFVHSLVKAGYSRRLSTMMRFFLPVGWQGLHFREDPASFYGVWGKGVYEGRITSAPFELTPDMILDVRKGVKDRLIRIFQYYLGRPCSDKYAELIASRMLECKLNAVEVLHRMRDSDEHFKVVKKWLNNGFPVPK